MSHFRNCTSRHSAQPQQGRGVGNVLKSLVRKVTPAIKSVGSNILTAPVTKTILGAAKEIGANAGLDILKDTLKGKDVSNSVGRNVSVAKKKLSEALLKQLYKQVEKENRKRTASSALKKTVKKKKIDFVFDDEDVVID